MDFLAGQAKVDGGGNQQASARILVPHLRLSESRMASILAFLAMFDCAHPIQIDSVR
jgi:hypothetical protein